MEKSWIFYVFFAFQLTGFGQTQNCDYSQQISLGETYYIYNEAYPNNYQGAQSCRWVANSPLGTRIVVTCEEINLPSSTGCTADRLLVSLSGDSTFIDSQRHCGSGTLSVTTNFNRLAVALRAPSSTSGGRFVCSIAAARISGCSCGWTASSVDMMMNSSVYVHDGLETNVNTDIENNTLFQAETEEERKHKEGFQMSYNRTEEMGPNLEIVGGQDASPYEFPFMAALINTETSAVLCGASILNERYALTAAHCFSENSASTTGLLVGVTTLSKASTTPTAALHRIQSVITHERYNANTNVNDIALILTVTTISISYYVGRSCLPFSYGQYSFAGQTVTAVGWGLLEFSGASADTLQKVGLPVQTNSACSQTFPSTIYNTQLCTYSSSGKDTCIGDSGSPLLWRDSYNRKQVVAMVSYGTTCGSGSVNTRVTSYLTWIVSHAPTVTYCI